jgi:hypothetical protein
METRNAAPLPASDLCDGAVNAQERLQAAHRDAWAGKHAQALSEYIWFHHHALDEEPALYGVRLSFALSYWKELADVFPPALAALIQTRDDKRQRLIAGETKHPLFHDLAAINEHLGKSSETAALFELLDRQAPHFAQACSKLALQALVDSGRFALAAKYSPDPADQLEQLAKQTNHDVASMTDKP